MVINEPLPFVENYVDELNSAIQKCNPEKKLSRIQRGWLSFCLMAIMLTNSICWARFQRAGMGKHSIAALSWVFRKSSIPWEWLLQASVIMILRKYNITEGVAGIDDSDKKRSKSTRKIFKTRKIKDKSTGGYMMGQCIVFLILITPQISFPVGFAFHMPDPALVAWHKNNEKLKKKGIPASRRPPRPERNPAYPTIPQIALMLLQQFRTAHPEIRIRCVLADALYGTDEFVRQASDICGGAQVISQIRSNQVIRYKNKDWHVEDWFKSFPGTEQIIRIRGGEQVTVTVGSARLYVQAHGRKLFVIALKYEDEEDYRYLIASDLSWRTIDIVETYTLSWLVEVFFQDWKASEGWGNLTKQTGEEGSVRSLILSLLIDHCLFFHMAQTARLENKLPAYTVGSLIEAIKVENIVAVFEQIILSGDPVGKFREFAKLVYDNVISLNVSKKHMAGRNTGNQKPSPSLQRRFCRA